MAIKVSQSTIIDDSRNVVNAGVGTFTGSLAVGTGSSTPAENSFSVNANVELLGITTVGTELVVSAGSTFVGVSTFADKVYV